MADSITFRADDELAAALRSRAKQSYRGNLSALIVDWLTSRAESEGDLGNPHSVMLTELEATVALAGVEETKAALKAVRAQKMEGAVA